MVTIHFTYLSGAPSAAKAYNIG